MNYHQLLRGLDMFKFDMIGDDSFNHLNERMMVHDSFSASVKPKVATAELTSTKSGCIKFAKYVAITSLLG